MRALPHLLTPGADGLDPETELLIIAHTVLDDGLDFCGACEALVRAGRFCCECGGALVANAPQAGQSRPVRKCPNERCNIPTTSTWCSACGARVIHPELQAIEEGRTTLIESLIRGRQRYLAALERMEAQGKRFPGMAPQTPDDAERRALYKLTGDT